MIYPNCRDLVTNYALVQIFRMAPTRRGEEGNPEPPPSPSMAEVLMAIELNRQHSDRLFEQLVQLGARSNTECNNLYDFLQSQPPTFASAKEPLDADDWLRALGECPMLLGRGLARARGVPEWTWHGIVL